MAFDPQGPLWMALILLVGVVLVRYSGYAQRIKYGLGLLIASAVFFFLEAVTNMGIWTRAELVYAQGILVVAWNAIAWILVLLSAFFITAKLVKVK